MKFIAFLRQFRIGPFAVFDVVLGYVGILLLSPHLKHFLLNFISLFHGRLGCGGCYQFWWCFISFFVKILRSCKHSPKHQDFLLLVLFWAS